MIRISDFSRHTICRKTITTALILTHAKSTEKREKRTETKIEMGGDRMSRMYGKFSTELNAHAERAECVHTRAHIEHISH